MPPRAFSLLVITDWSLGQETLLRRLEAALGAGSGIAVQHRHPGQTDRLFFEEGQALRELCDRFSAPLFINGRVDLALALNAHLHCTSRSMSPRQCRPLMGQRWISVSVHAPEDDATDADIALVSPVFKPLSKTNDHRAPLGVAGFEKLARQLPCTSVALGGIDASNAHHLRGHPLSCISGVLHADDSQAAARTLLQCATLAT
jgi:thiamine-phosphate pyrophosphorylase